MKDEINGIVRRIQLVSELMKKKIKWQAFGKYCKSMEGAKLSISTIAAKNIRVNGWLLLRI